MNFCEYLLKGKKNSNKKLFIDKKILFSHLYDHVHEASKEFKKFKRKIIALSFENSYEFLVLYLAIIKSKNVVLIIEKGLPNKEYFRLMQKYKINILFTDREIKLNNENKKFKFIPEKFFFSKKNYFKIINNIKHQEKNKNYLEDVCVILFTSGSTGEKKGVMLTNKNLIFNTNAILKSLPIKKSDVVNLVLPCSYSFGLSVINTHLKIGSSFFFHNSPFIGSVIKEIKEKKCTCFYGVPSTFQILINKTNFMKESFNKINFIAQAGGELNIAYKKSLAIKFQNKFYVMYGATEASPRLSLVNPKNLLKKLNSIGKPIKGVKFKLFKILNSKFDELGVSGRNIMKGYLFNKQLTDKSFRKNYYMTGDLATKDKDGYYYLIKRKDKIFKRYGFKVHPSAIENKINKLNFVKKSIITNSSENKMILRVYIEKNLNFDVQKKINSFIRSNLTSYEFPDEIIILKSDINTFSKDY